MKVCQLIDLLRGFDLDADVYMQTDSRCFSPPVWIGILDTAGLFDEGKNIQLVISPWESDEYPASSPQFSDEAVGSSGRQGSGNVDEGAGQ